MGEFLEHYGGLIVGVVVATALSFFLIFARDTCNDTLAEKAVNQMQCNQEYIDVSGIITENEPELDVLNGITVEKDEEFDPEEAVVSAYNSDNFSVNEISGNAAKNITNIKKALAPGSVNVVYPAGFSTEREGKHTIWYYAKNKSKAGLWTRRKCKVAVVKYETKQGKD